MWNTRLTLVLAAATASSAVGCVDNDSTIFIAQMMQIDPESECTVVNDPSSPSISAGVIDVSITDQYFGMVLVGNQLVRRGDPQRLRTETGRVQLFEAEVEVFDYAGATLSSFIQPVSGFIDVATGANPGWGLTGLTLIDGAAAAASGGNAGLVARIRIRGETLGGLEVETGEWDFPINVCNGCFLIVEPATCEDERVETCMPGQDSRRVDARDVFRDHPCNTP
jgi:hypothetical protein